MSQHLKLSKNLKIHLENVDGKVVHTGKIEYLAPLWSIRTFFVRDLRR